MSSCFTAVGDGLSNLAASLGTSRDKASGDGFVLFPLDRGQLEAMYRGDWLARKVVDLVPYDSVRAWRAWSGHRGDVERVEAAERRLGLRRAVQRAMVLGRLYGGGAIVIGTGESDPAALARPLDAEALPRGGLRFLHAVSRWQLSAPEVDLDPLSPWFGEARLYEVCSPGRGALMVHPSRVVRFLGHELPDPSLGLTAWSDSVLQVLYDAVHAAALTLAGATSLIHEAKVDVVTVPNLSEHLASAATTAQLSARFGYAAAMKSINNLLLLGDGETWSRQRVDFAGLPEMVRTFLQVAAGAADVPVTRLLGQSPSGLSATGESDTRNYYDMIAARQELELRPQLERLDRLVLRSEGLDPGALTFAFRPLWQLDAQSKAGVALAKAQASAVYAGLGLWPAAVTARLVEAQVAADGVYPNAEAVFAAARAADAPAAAPAPVPGAAPTRDFDPAQPRAPDGRWTAGGGGGPHAPDGTEITPAGSGRGGMGGARALLGLMELLGLGRSRQTGRPAGTNEPARGAASEGSPEAAPSPPPVPGGVGRAGRPAGAVPASSEPGAQTELNKLAQSRDPRIRSDLADGWINDDGSLRWPPDKGADGPETPLTLQPGQLVDRYGSNGGYYLSPQHTPFTERSLPYDAARTPLRTFRVLKPLTVGSGRVSPWFDQPGGGLQFRTSTDVDSLINDGYLQLEGE